MEESKITKISGDVTWIGIDHSASLKRIRQSFHKIDHPGDKKKNNGKRKGKRFNRGNK